MGHNPIFAFTSFDKTGKNFCPPGGRDSGRAAPGIPDRIIPGSARTSPSRRTLWPYGSVRVRNVLYHFSSIFQAASADGVPNLEQALGIFLDRFLPLTHLDRVHFILLSDFVDRLHSLQGLKPNLGLVLRTVDLAFLFGPCWIPG